MLIMVFVLMALATGYLVGLAHGMDLSFGIAASLILAAVGIGAFVPPLIGLAVTLAAVAAGLAGGGISHERSLRR